ncbi:hypothetical protein [Siphonobacter sp. BAB-5385]
MGRIESFFEPVSLIRPVQASQRGISRYGPFTYQAYRIPTLEP